MEAICYPCALRLSMLFNSPPPKPLSQLLADNPDLLTASAEPTLPVRDAQHHKRFIVVHETHTSVQRYLDNAAAAAEGTQRESHTEPTLPVKVAAAVHHNGNCRDTQSCVDGMFAGEDAPPRHVSWLCAACGGLYQFLDLVHVPLVAAAVRTSPYFDSRTVTINVNVNRSVTFLWLAAAARYFDTAGTGAEPPATSAVPEEMCNFKEFYGGDVRARVMLYLRPAHADTLRKGAQQLPGLETYRAAVEEKLAALVGGSGSSSSTTPSACPSGSPPLKRHRTEDEDEASTTKEAAAGSADGAHAPSAPQTALQAFDYDLDGRGVVVDVYFRHRPSEFLLTERLVPADYCSNRSTIITFGFVRTYVTPHLTSRGLIPTAPEGDATRVGGAAAAGAVRETATVSTSIWHANIFLMGNYRKMQRNLSQSPWFFNGVRIGSASLQELLATPILPFFFPEGVTPALPAATTAAAALEEHGSGGNPYHDALVKQRSAARVQGSAYQSVDPCLTAAREVFGFGRYKFHSAGREDVDVRMLGHGRPFVLEIISPSRERVSAADLAELQRRASEHEGGGVDVENLRLTDAQVTVRLARHSESKVKRYRCVVWVARALQGPEDPALGRLREVRDLAIEQKTPLRVLHRRSLHARPRTIHSISATVIGPHWLLLDLETQAGTYVKEFVHGDMGRTLPNLGSLLGCRADIVQLDVVGMEMQDLDTVPASEATTTAP